MLISWAIDRLKEILKKRGDLKIFVLGDDGYEYEVKSITFEKTTVDYPSRVVIKY